MQSGRSRLVGWIFAVVLSAGIFCLVFFLEKKWSLTGYADALFLASAPMILIPVLVYIGRTGVFDTMRYSFLRLFESFKPGNEKQFDTAYDYHEYKRGKRQANKPYFLPFFVVGGIVLLVASILSILAVFVQY